MGEAPDGDDPGGNARGRRSARSAADAKARVPDADDAFRGRREPDHPPPARSGSRRSPTRRRTTSATPRRTGKRRSAFSAKTPHVVLVLGSQNSSNSQRLAELARESGRAAYLIDGVPRHSTQLVPPRRHGPRHGRALARRNSSSKIVSNTYASNSTPRSNPAPSEKKKSTSPPERIKRSSPRPSHVTASPADRTSRTPPRPFRVFRG